MTRKRHEYLNDFIVNQFDVKKLKELIISFLDLTETFKLMLSNDYYDLNLSSKYEIKIHSNITPSKSKVESLVIKTYKNLEIIQDTIVNMYSAFNSLNEMERKVFYTTFFEGKSDLEIMAELDLYSALLLKIRKSAIVKFSLSTGLDKFVNII